MSDDFAGALRERISIDQPAPARDPLAARQGQWLSDGSAWARVTPLIPVDLTAADALTALPRWAITLRMRAGLMPGSRILWRGRYLVVRSVICAPQLPDRLTLTCEEMR